jgi:hypothetical protein
VRLCPCQTVVNHSLTDGRLTRISLQMSTHETTRARHLQRSCPGLSRRLEGLNGTPALLRILLFPTCPYLLDLYLPTFLQPDRHVQLDLETISEDGGMSRTRTSCRRTSLSIEVGLQRMRSRMIFRTQLQNKGPTRRTWMILERPV